jgi:hypothetical protein
MHGWDMEGEGGRDWHLALLFEDPQMTKNPPTRLHLYHFPLVPQLGAKPLTPGPVETHPNHVSVSSKP